MMRSYKVKLKAMVISALVLASLLTMTAVPQEETLLRIMNDRVGTLVVNVTDEVGRPISEAIVMISESNSIWQTDLNGSVRIENVSIGAKMINASKQGYLPDSTAIIIAENATNYVTLVIKGGTIIGEILTESNIPVPNATVQIAGYPQFLTLSLSDGSYSISGVPNGTYAVSAFAQIYSPSTTIVSITAGSSKLLIFRLSRLYGAIEGYVMESLVPIQGANVSITINKIKYVSESDGTGHYLIPNVPEGNYSVIASKEGYSTQSISNVTVQNGNTTRLDFNLISLPASLTGVVSATLTIGTVLVFNAKVEILTTGLITNTSTQGSYSIYNVPIGVFTVKVSASGYEDNITSGVVFDRGRTVRLDIVLIPKPGQLIGIVREKSSSWPVSGYMVIISGPEQRETKTSENGQYVFAGLMPGNYTITVKGPPGSRLSPFLASGIVITADDVTQYDIYLSPAKEALGGFMYGMDLPHSFMVVAFSIMILILGLTIYLRLRAFQNPAKARKELEEEIAAEEAEENIKEKD